MLQYDPLDCLPSAEDLPDSDDTPVDNELQDLIPGLLKAILAFVWADRMDWFFGVDMGIYYDPNQPAIVPDGFLSLGVERIIDENLRLSYLLWEEQRVPIMVLEVVSHKRRGEYTTKKEFYTRLEVLYYVIYNPQRRRKPALEVYRLVNGNYQLQRGNPVWLPEIGLGIGCERGTYLGVTREWLYWYTEQDQRLLTPEERMQQSQQQAQQAQQRAQMLAERLRSLGIDPDSLV
ncbi:Uma2 family endonuclease [Halotia wernerae UHCC 0503]|nr:Uma2 family endonuclease [Halotia wernerae UHCC 0503]